MVFLNFYVREAAMMVSRRKKRAEAASRLSRAGATNKPGGGRTFQQIVFSSSSRSLAVADNLSKILRPEDVPDIPREEETRKEPDQEGYLVDMSGVDLASLKLPGDDDFESDEILMGQCKAYGKIFLSPGSQVLDSRGILENLSREGRRPATALEVLFLRNRLPGVVKEFNIVALGTVVFLKGNKQVLCLYSFGGASRTRLLPFSGGPWGNDWYFASLENGV